MAAQTCPDPAINICILSILTLPGCFRHANSSSIHIQCSNHVSINRKVTSLDKIIEFTTIDNQNAEKTTILSRR